MHRRTLLKGSAALGFATLASGLVVPKARAQAFTPSSIANCQLWLRADLGVTSSGGVVSAWADQSGNANNFSQSTGGAQPTLNTAGSALINGQASLSFNGSQWLHSTQSFLYFPMTAFAVFVRRGTNLHSAFAAPVFSTDHYPTNSISGGQSIVFDSSNDLNFQVDNNFIYPKSGTCAVALGTPYLVRAEWGGAIGTSDGLLDACFNNVRCNAGCGYDSTALVGTNGSDIGTFDQSSTYCAVFDLAEVVVYSGVLADSDLDALYGYFQSRYQLPGRMDQPFRAAFFQANGVPYGGSNGGQGEFLRCMSSPDGVTFDEFFAHYTPSTGTVRDPSLINFAGTWWVAHTNVGESGTGSTWGLASSANGHGFTPVATPSVASISGVQYPWGPKWYIDQQGNPHILLSCAVTLDINTYYEMHPTNAAWTTWSNPVALTMDGSMPTGGNGIIDFHAFWFNNALYAIFKNETTHYGCLAKSSGDWNGTWSEVVNNIGGWGTAEGFSGVALSPTHLRIYMDDAYNNYGGGLHYSDGTGSTDPTAMSWTTPAAITLNSPAYSGTRNGVFTLANDQRAPLAAVGG